ncbi:MAG: hypothetical protein KAG18_01395 [Sinobacterium sp.]|nr:hypothetical protein [Sinobacterium sp.]
MKNNAMLIRLICITLLLANLSACSHNPFNKTSTLNWLLESQQFDDAITLFNKLEQEQRAEFSLQDIETDREKFILLALKNSRRATAKKQWLEAQYILEDALTKTPSSHSLQTEIAVLKQRMSKLEADLLIALQLKTALQYLDRKPLVGKWLLLSESTVPYIQPSLSTERRREHLAITLGEHGLSLLQANPQQGKVFLQTASDLSPDERWTKALSSINAKKANKAHREKKQQRKIRELAFSDLQKNFNQHFSKQEYIKAKKSISHASNVAQTDKEKAWVKKQQRKLEKAVTKNVEAALKRGQISYSKGRIDEAISIWKQALRLSPNNRQLKDSLNRANKFKQTYESLK